MLHYPDDDTTDLIASHLVHLADSADGWTTLFRDPLDERYWVRTFPQSHLQNGGPPTLRCVSRSEASARFGVDTRTEELP